MKSEDRVKRELAKVQADIQKLESELDRHSNQTAKLEEDLSEATSTSSVEELLERNRSILKQLKEHNEERSSLTALLEGLRKHEDSLNRKLFEFEKERQIKQHNKRMLDLYGSVKSYNKLVGQANAKLEEIKNLYHQKLPEEYRSGVEAEQILKSTIASPFHIPQLMEPIPISNEEKLMEARADG